MVKEPDNPEKSDVPEKENLEDTALDASGIAEEIKDRIPEELFETSFNNPQQPEVDDSSNPGPSVITETENIKKIKSVEADEFAMQELEEEEIFDDGPKFNHPNSILDLIKGGEDSLPDAVYENVDLNSKTEGKNLEELLKVSQKDESEWHESKVAEEGLKEKSAAIKKRQRRLFIATPLIILAAGVACFYIILPSFAPLPETEKIRFPKSKKKINPEKLKIDPNLKDEGKLNKYFQLADDLFNNKKYEKAEIVYKKLLPTNWNSADVLEKLGRCREALNDEKGALEFYKKALKKSFGGKVDLPLRLAEILQKQGDYQGIIDSLGPLEDKFETNIKLQLIMAESYLKLNMSKEALASFKKLNIQFLNQDQLKAFAKLLMQENDTKNAFKVYLFLGQNFGEMESLYNAAHVAPNPKLKIAVLTELVGKTRGQPNWDNFKLALGKELLAQGKKRDALKVLDSINPVKLSPDDSLKFLKMIASCDNSSSIMDACEIILTRHFLKDLNVQKEICEILIKNDKSSIATAIYKKQVLANPKSSIANYMYATVANGTNNKIRFYNQAISLEPNFYAALMNLGELYCEAGRWNEAIKVFKKCSRLKPNSKRPKYWIAIVEIRRNPTEKPLQAYSEFLIRTHTPEQERLKELIALAQYLPTDKKAMEYIKQMAKYPKLKEFMDLQTIRTKLIYNSLQDSDFVGKRSSEIKKYRILYLLGKGKLNDVMMMPVLKKEFPEFWKVFICWRKDISSWRENCRLIQTKHPNNKAYLLCSKIWLDEISPTQTLNQLADIEYTERPLTYLMIAERYRKDGNRIKSSIFYQTAIKFNPPNIYKEVAEYLKDN